VKNKLIIIRIKGGLGNQLFQYNLGEYLSSKLGYIVKYDIKTGYLNDAFNRNVCFNSIFNNDEALIYRGIFSNIFILRILKKITNLLNTSFFNYFYINENNNFNIEFLFHYLNITSNNLILEGYWQDINFIYDKFVEKLNLNQKEIFVNYNSNDLIIHYRSDHFSESFDFEYYNTAIKKMIFNFPNINNILIYSDSNKVTELLNYLKITYEIPIQADYNDYDPYLLLNTIAKSKYFIASNGTFSFWAMLLGKNRVIIAPPNLKINNLPINNNIYLYSNE
jgi:hypothetical protein